MNLGYIFSRYPLVSETFILREMEALAALGHHLEAAPLLPAQPLRLHNAHRLAAASIGIAPWLPARPLAVHAGYCRQAPGGYFRTAALALWSHKSNPNALAGAAAFWPKAVAIASRFQAAGVEHVHAHYGTHPALVAWMVHRLTGLPFSFTVHAHDLFVHRAGLETKLAAAAFVVAISEFNRGVLAGAFPRWAAKIAVIHCGIRPEFYRRARRPAAGSPLRIVCVASLQPYKGHATLLAALDRLRGRLDFSCRVIGSGPRSATLLETARRLGLASLVTFCGPANEAEVAGELAQADVFVLPSVVELSGRMEGVPVALMEAMAAGVPVVASRLSGIPELVGDGESGLLVEPGDAGALAEAIWQMRLPQVRLRLGERGRERVGAGFDLRDSARQLAALFAGAAPSGAAEAVRAPAAAARPLGPLAARGPASRTEAARPPAA